MKQRLALWGWPVTTLTLSCVCLWFVLQGAESHAGQIFCCVGALSIGNALHHVDADLLGWWLCERQVDSGGLNGRPEKQADVCYSWWILSSLAIIGRLVCQARRRPAVSCACTHCGSQLH